MSTSKFGSIRTLVEGITFASRKEASRYQLLRLLEKAGRISKLELQPRYELKVNGFLVTTYVADFRYVEAGNAVVEDVKGMRTPVYNIKKKLIRAILGIEIRET
mgnify:FL=1